MTSFPACRQGFGRFAPLTSFALDCAGHYVACRRARAGGACSGRPGFRGRFPVFGSCVWWGSKWSLTCFRCWLVRVAVRWFPRRVVWRPGLWLRCPGVAYPVWRWRVAQFAGGCGRLPGRGLARSWSLVSARRRRLRRFARALRLVVVSPWRSDTSPGSGVFPFRLRCRPGRWRGCRFRVRCPRFGCGRVAVFLFSFLFVCCPACAGFFCLENPD